MTASKQISPDTTIGVARLQALLSAYDHPQGAVLPLAVLLRDAGVEIDVDVIGWLATVCKLTPAQVIGAVSSFPPLGQPPRAVTVCDGLSCRLMGARTVHGYLQERLGEARVCFSPCQNSCSSAPVLQVNGVLYGALHQQSLTALADRLEAATQRR